MFFYTYNWIFAYLNSRTIIYHIENKYTIISLDPAHECTNNLKVYQKYPTELNSEFVNTQVSLILWVNHNKLRPNSL